MRKHSRYFRSQNYTRLKHECTKKKKLFVDVEFTPTNDSLFLNPSDQNHPDIVWKRPAEIVGNPQLFVEGASANDVTQGILGNCWFVSACSALTHNTVLLNKVIPNANKQEWSSNNCYAGIFRFRFWRFDQWLEVVVDDLLPVRDGKLIFARSKTENEFWSALLEKAFAKLYGCYENLVGGQLADALQDVSGGVVVTISVPRYLSDTGAKSSENLFETIRLAFDKNALIVAAIATKSKKEVEQALDCGLVKGHAYAVTAVRYIQLDAKNRSFVFFSTVHRQIMIRLQNPWGEKEWNGPWSDESIEWEQVTESQKKEIGITVDEDGEFWMPWEEFVKHFTDLSVCQLFNTSVLSRGSKYYEWKFFSEWKSYGKAGSPKDRAGGCINFTTTFCSNPQYIFVIENDGGDVMLALTQKDKKEDEKMLEPFVTIGIHVMQVERNREYRIHQAINPIATSDYVHARSAYLHLTDLKKGCYLLLPTTFAPREHAQFLLRMYSEKNCHPRKLERHAPYKPFFFCRKALAISRIEITGLKLNTNEALKLYAVLKHNDEKVRLPTLEGVHIEWNELFIFYEKALRCRYLIEIYEERLVKDRLIDCVRIVESVENDSRPLELDLNNSDGLKIGTLYVLLQSYDDLLYL